MKMRAADLFKSGVKTYRKSINPPYVKRDIIPILSTVFILIVIPLTVIAILNSRGYQPRAAGQAVRGVSGDLWADIIIGKPDFSEINPGTTVSYKLWLPHGVVIDRSSSPQKMYVYDAGNNRILGFNWDKCLASTTNPANCSADIVIGQPNMSTSACNGDSGFQNYPDRAVATASTLCGLNESQLSIAEGGSGASMAVDSQGNLYVFDAFNNRVLKYNRPFATDQIADEVWGQNDFSGESCNKGGSSPDATTLCYDWGNSNNWTAGVDVDSVGNLWVVDNQNNRVLRFPPGSKTANLVLGQANFTSRGSGSGLNQFHDPSAVRVNSSGWVYVADHYNNRVLVFKPPFSNGMNGSVFGSGFSVPSGIDFDPTEPGRVWIDNTGHQIIELWDENSRTLIKEVGWRGNGNVLGDSTGSVGIDSAGNILAAIGTGDYDNDVLLFKKDDPVNYPTKPSKRIFGWGGTIGNLKTGSSLASVRGIVVAEDQSPKQLIVADYERLMFWDDPASLTNGKPADGVAGLNLATYKGVSNATDINDRAHGCCWVMKADKNNNLFVAVDGYGNVQKHIDIFHLPLTNGAAPYKTITASASSPLPVLGGGQISSMSPWGMAITDNDEFLWITDSDNSRVFRIRNPLTSPVVDVVLGQTNVDGKICNRDPSSSPPTTPLSTDPTTLCWPGSLSLDRAGNLYVSDSSLEIRGNMRLLEFNIFPTNNTSVIYAPAASKIFPNIATWGTAFDSQNRMVVGYNAYHDVNPQHGWFPGVYNDPLSASTAPDALLKDFYSLAFTATFDSSDNLYVGDGIRARVLIYKKPFGGGPKPGDLNGDNKVDIFDLSILLSNWSASGVAADINKDGVVNILDLSILLSNWSN
jgi:hypothetical protein